MNLSLFRNRNFTLIVFGKFVSIIGTQMQNFALSLYVLAETGSAAKFSILLSFNFIPHILFGVIGGVVADNVSKKKILVIADTLCGVLTLAFLSYTYFVTFSYLLACVLVFSLATINVFFSPAIDALIPISVGKDYILPANSINRCVLNIGKLVAPLLAGIFYPLVGLTILLMIDGVSFLLSAFSELFIIPEKDQEHLTKFNIKEVYSGLISGISYVWHNNAIKHLLSINFIFNFFLYPMFAIMVPFVLKVVMGVSAFQFGLSISIYTAGVALGIMFMKKRNEKTFLLKKFSLGTIVLSIITFIIGVIFLSVGSIPMIVSYVLLVSSNFAFGYFIVYWALPSMSFYQLVTPKDKIGRVMGVENMNEKLGCVLGQLTIGVLSDWLMPGIIVIFSAMILMTASLVSYRIINRDT
ncbi:MAG: MFS transporter [Vallitaleaceae bacterium]|jgi:MFS family permease|nr:MFS transporter [Vallitaleaceae bacterium]